jgi:DNA polymerase elongation subunit (family B)
MIVNYYFGQGEILNMKYYFIKCEYRISEELPEIYLFGRDLISKEKSMFKIVGFEPHFFVLESESVPKIPQIKRVQSGFKSIFGEPVKKIVVGIPEDVKDIKTQFSKHFQADIPFTRLFLVVTGIRRYFTIPDGKEELNWKEVMGE